MNEWKRCHTYVSSVSEQQSTAEGASLALRNVPIILRRSSITFPNPSRNFSPIFDSQTSWTNFEKSCSNLKPRKARKYFRENRLWKPKSFLLRAGFFRAWICMDLVDMVNFCHFCHFSLLHYPQTTHNSNTSLFLQIFMVRNVHYRFCFTTFRKAPPYAYKTGEKVNFQSTIGCLLSLSQWKNRTRVNSTENRWK